MMRETQSKENVEPTRNNTRAFLEIFLELIRNHYVTSTQTNENVKMIETDFQKKKKKPEIHAGKRIQVQIPVHPFLPDNKTAITTL